MVLRNTIDRAEAIQTSVLKGILSCTFLVFFCIALISVMSRSNLKEERVDLAYVIEGEGRTGAEAETMCLLSCSLTAARLIFLIRSSTLCLAMVLPTVAQWPRPYYMNLQAIE